MEGSIEKTAWRPDGHGDVYLRMIRAHLGALTAWGYAPSPIEKRIMTGTEGGEAA
jgi:hypothetical protein